MEAMKKIKLEMESLVVESFTTATDESGRGTVVGHDPTQGHNVGCGSAYDACNTGLCTPNCQPTYSPDACPTAYPEYC
jgi:hypothetical protein